MAVVTAASVAVTVVTTLLAIAAILARDEATQRRSQAEDLLGFMVGDLRKSLAPIGRLDLLEEVGARAMAYFATVDLDALSQRVVEVLLMTGELNRAQELADEAILAFDRLTGYDEGNIEWRRASTEPRIAKGFALAASGQLDEALGLANQCISVLQSIIASGTADYNLRYHLADAYDLATWVYQANNDVAAALESNQQAVDHLQVIQASDRLNDERTGKLASIYVVSGERAFSADNGRAGPRRRAIWHG